MRSLSQPLSAHTCTECQPTSSQPDMPQSSWENGTYRQPCQRRQQHPLPHMRPKVPLAAC
eukprot:3301591-Prymnesium_polylepis.2